LPAQVEVHSTEVEGLNHPGEFSRLVGMSDAEARETALPVSPIFRFWRDHLDLVLSAFQADP